MAKGQKASRKCNLEYEELGGFVVVGLHEFGGEGESKEAVGELLQEKKERNHGV